MEMSDLRKMENFIWHSMMKDMTYVFVCPEGKLIITLAKVTVKYTERW